jgi:hypothetical protein
MPPQRHKRDPAYKSRLNDAIAYFYEHGDAHTIAWIATTYDVDDETLRRRIRQQPTLPTCTTMPRPTKCNRILTPLQEAAICQFIHDQLNRGVPANRAMILRAVADLRPGKSPPSQRWLQRFLKAHPEFHTIRTKSLNT